MYRFKLEPLLRHRKHLEEDCQKKLAVLEEKLGLEQRRLDALRKRLAEAKAGLRGLQSATPDIAGIQAAIAFMARLGEEIEVQRAAVEKARTARDSQRCDLVEAMKGRKTMEKLKEKGRAVHKREEARSHQNFMNEIAINRFTRNH